MYTLRLRLQRHPAFWINVFLAVFIIFLSYAERLLLLEGTFYSFPDERFFANAATFPFSEIIVQHSRYLIFVLFSRVTIVSFGEWALKLQSVPFGLLTGLLLYDATRKINLLYFFPILFGYFLMLSTLMLRDAIIIFFNLFFLLNISRSKNSISLLWYAIAVAFFSFIRPEFAYVYILIFTWLTATFFLKQNVFLRFILPSVLVTVVFVVAIDLVVSVSDFFYPDRAITYLSNRDVELQRLWFLPENLSALIRQIVTPIPTSLMRRLVSQEMGDGLIIKDIFRVLLMTTFYIMTVSLAVKPRRAFSVLSKNYFIIYLLIFSVIVTIAYAIFGDGGGSTRNKVYPYLLIFCLFFLTYEFKVKSLVSY